MHNIILANRVPNANRLQGQPAGRPWMSISTGVFAFKASPAGLSIGDYASAR